MFGKRLYAAAFCVALPSVALIYPFNKAKDTPPSVQIPSEPQPDCEYPNPSWEYDDKVSVVVNGEPLPEYPARGRVYIEATEGREYSVHLRNPFGVRVAVALSVDGLNSIDARHTTAFDSSKWVIQPYGEITITGWQMSSSRARKFYFTSESDSYGAKLGQMSNLGVISAVFFREVRRYPYPVTSGEDSKNREESEMPSSAGRSAPSSDSAAAKSTGRAVRPRDDDNASTGIGRSVHNDVNWINLELEREPAAQVNLRYEYRPQLVRLGILPRPYAPDPVYRRENARGFEDRRYAPEP